VQDQYLEWKKYQRSPYKAGKRNKLRFDVQYNNKILDHGQYKLLAGKIEFDS